MIWTAAEDSSAEYARTKRVIHTLALAVGQLPHNGKFFISFLSQDGKKTSEKIPKYALQEDAYNPACEVPVNRLAAETINPEPEICTCTDCPQGATLIGSSLEGYAGLDFVHTCEYDERGNRTRHTAPTVTRGVDLPQIITESWTYNEFGQPLKHLDANGNLTKYVRESENLPAVQIYPTRENCPIY